MKIEIKKRIEKKFPYVYAQNCPKEYGDWRYQRTFYFLRWAIMISFLRNK